MAFMKRGDCGIFRAVIVLAAVRLCSAGEDVRTFDFTGYASMEGGQFVNHNYLATDYTHQWLQSNIMKLGVNATLNPRFDVRILAGADMTYNTIPLSSIADQDNYANSPALNLIVDRAEMILHCSADPRDSFLDIGIGVWDEKYNPEARDLGEYLFRTGAYPGYIYQQGFDKPYVNLAGIHIDNNLFGFWHNQALLTSETQLAPFNDFSFTFLTDFTLPQKVIDVGGGVQFFRCFSVDQSQTTPTLRYLFGVPGPTPSYYLTQVGTDASGNPLYDTSYYSFAGTKLMAHFTIDPKPLLGSGLARIFGAEDLKLFSEAAILGLKNYPANENMSSLTGNIQPINEFGYEQLMQEMPIMFGLNFPAFKLLEVLSCECEYYGKDYVNAVPIPSGDKLVNQGAGYLPIPPVPQLSLTTGAAEYPSNFYESNRAAHWKWSVYARRNLFGHFAVTAQVARDHILNTVQGLDATQNDNIETLVAGNQWYWMLKFSANF